MILSSFDPERQKAAKLKKEQEEGVKEQAKSGDKWDKLSKEIDRDEKIEEIVNTDFNK